MVSCAVLVLGPLWIQSLTQICRTEKLPRGVVVSWFRERVMEGLGLLQPPLFIEHSPNQERTRREARHRQARVPRTSRPQSSLHHHPSELILFPSPGEKWLFFFFFIFTLCCFKHLTLNVKKEKKSINYLKILFF